MASNATPGDPGACDGRGPRSAGSYGAGGSGGRVSIGAGRGDPTTAVPRGSRQRFRATDVSTERGGTRYGHCGRADGGQPARVSEGIAAGDATRLARRGAGHDLRDAGLPGAGLGRRLPAPSHGPADRARRSPAASASSCRRAGWWTPFTSRRTSGCARSRCRPATRCARSPISGAIRARSRRSDWRCGRPSASWSRARRRTSCSPTGCSRSPAGSRSTAGTRRWAGRSSRSARCMARGMPTTAMASAWSARSPTSTASARPIFDLLEDRRLAALVSDEGPISRAVIRAAGADGRLQLTELRR